eukprot:5638683-Pleurochrysis_carterae.AAC.1
MLSGHGCTQPHVFDNTLRMYKNRNVSSTGELIARGQSLPSRPPARFVRLARAARCAPPAQFAPNPAVLAGDASAVLAGDASAARCYFRRALL